MTAPQNQDETALEFYHFQILNSFFGQLYMGIKITMTLLVRNEEDIIADNLMFHHEQGVDNFIITDNLSTDNTAQIIKELSKKLDISYNFQSRDDYSQAKWVTEMARKACVDHKADWVINNDADEFWVPARGNLKSFLAGIPAEIGVLNVRRHNAVLILDPASQLAPACHPRRNVVFECNSLNNLGHPLPGKAMHRAVRNVEVFQGNHGVANVPGKEVAIDEGLRILHYPYRSLAHYKRKILTGGAAYNRNTELPQSVGGTWREHFRLLETGEIERFWEKLEQPPGEISIGLAMGTLFRDTTVSDVLGAQAKFPREQKLQAALKTLRERTQALVKEIGRTTAANLLKVEKELRPNRPLYYNLEFCLSGPLRQLEVLTNLEKTSPSVDLCKRFGDLRDAFSLFPRNSDFKTFLGAALTAFLPEAVAQLRSHCAGKKIILHTSCRPRMPRAEASIASFAEQDSTYHHIILIGIDRFQSEDETELSFQYDGRVLIVPVPDNYECLHRKIFYALTLLDLVADPSLVIKIDDDLSLVDRAAFEAMVESAATQQFECAGRIVGSSVHQEQWHGWHISKCEEPRIEMRGYQYPLPRSYAAGGYGYLLGRKGLEACSYMYLAMKEFFAMRTVGLEDAYVGHALYAQGIALHDVSFEDQLLALPGLAKSDRTH